MDTERHRLDVVGVGLDLWDRHAHVHQVVGRRVAFMDEFPCHHDLLADVRLGRQRRGMTMVDFKERHDTRDIVCNLVVCHDDPIVNVMGLCGEALFVDVHRTMKGTIGKQARYQHVPRVLALHIGVGLQFLPPSAIVHRGLGPYLLSFLFPCGFNGNDVRWIRMRQDERERRRLGGHVLRSFGFVSRVELSQNKHECVLRT